MLLELSQLLCTAHRIIDGVQEEEIRTLSNGRTRRHKVWVLPDMRNDILYSATHVNHPCAVWVRECDSNYMTCYQLYRELCKEYTRRYKKIHLCETKLYTTLSNPPLGIRQGPSPTQPPQCMPDEYKVPNDPVQAYRNYYIGSKSEIATWKYSPTPEWFVT